MRESKNIEFKSIWKDDNLKTLCAFANSDGGVIYLEMDDDDGNSKELENIDKLLVELP